ncbi:MAG: DJ-1/PfpI family protein [Candidatus Dormibacteraeota bacterium]|nr:DJ-1/PfpI family protein [Candidatus Dormibacteraeota bacterium]MBO0761397.1 DJ-1/PfpI family protein [Candidatus Dormibacteraeota bacterium]
MDIGYLVYPRHTPLDLIGPCEVLGRLPDARTHLVWTRPGPVQADRGVEISATTSFADAPRLDVVVVPGGPGQAALMKHAVLLDYLRDCAQTAVWMASVCTGALLLAQAGLLRGRRATTHWLARDTLRTFGVDVGDDRYVFDDKFATAAGVSAGLDLALELARRIGGEQVAQAIQLQIEYDPQPPLRAGSPRTAPGELVESLRQRARAYG